LFAAGDSTNLDTDSLQLKGTGTKYSDFTWTSDSTASFGALNDGQTFRFVGLLLTQLADRQGWKAQHRHKQS
jgi:hypothetical protein